MSFRIGQRVRIARTYRLENRRYIGLTGTVSSAPFEQEYEAPLGTATTQAVTWDDGSEWGGKMTSEPICCLEPIDDPKQFERFMERVLKPLPQPVLETA